MIAIANQKGGVGKTTTAINLAACLAASGRETLLVDMDPQGNATSGLGVDRASLELDIYQLLLDSTDPQRAVRTTGLEHLRLLPATPDLVGVEFEMFEREDRAHRLRAVLAPLLGDYDYILIDSPPSMGLLAVNVLAAANQALIPVQSEYFALEGLSLLIRTIDRVKASVNPQLSVLGLVLTLYDGRTNLAQQVEAEVRRVFGDRVFRTLIQRSVRLSESASFGKPIILYDVRSRGAQNYMELCQEVVHVCEETGPGAGA